MRFKDRSDAGRKLAARLASFKNESPVILALPRGGVTVAAEVATALAAPLDIVLVRKIGAPLQPELALGAVVDGGEPIISGNADIIDSTATSEDEFRTLCQQQIAEIERRRQRYVGYRQPLDVAGRTVIVVDDGIATGATARVALRATRARGPKKLVLAIPVAPAETVESLGQDADEVICLEKMGPFAAIGYHYDDFRQLTDDEVVRALLRFHTREIPRSVNVSAEDVRHTVGDIYDTKVSEILTLTPSPEELAHASMWARGNGDFLDREGHKLQGKTARIVSILTADEEDER